MVLSYYVAEIIFPVASIRNKSHQDERFMLNYYFFLCSVFFLNDKRMFLIIIISLQFVYLRDNLLSTLEGVEILTRVKVCYL